MSASQVAADVRKYPRVSEDCEVNCELIDDDVRPEGQDGVALNISGGGMCFSTLGPLPVGAMVALQVNLPQLPSRVVALAKVCWSRPQADTGKFDNGVEFWWIGWRDEQAQDAMLDYVKGKLDKPHQNV
jgi:hypothetical protein